MSKIIKPALLLAAMLCLSFSVLHADRLAKRKSYQNPVIKSSVPDPTVIRADDGYFYLYGTEDMANMPIYRSLNLVDWTFVGTAFTEATRPRCVRPYTKGMMWAPDINYFNGHYVLYYSIGVWGSAWECGVGVATSERPEGPFVDQGVVFMGKDLNVGNSIDQFFIEEGGKKYMFWGSYWGIYAVQLTDDGLRVMPGSTPQQICNTQMEGTYIHKRNGYYYLIGSNGNCCQSGGDYSVVNYKLICGRSTSLFGPYVTKDGRKLLDSSSNYENFLLPNEYCLGPGHNAEWVEDDKGNTWIIYHGYLRSELEKQRMVWLDQVKWKDDWPYMESSCPSPSATAPYFKGVN